MPAETELLACPNPWCCSTTMPLPGFSTRSEHWRVICACGVRTFGADTEEAAIALWNTRATPALPEERETLVENLRSFEAVIRSEVEDDREEGHNAFADLRERRAEELAEAIAFIERAPSHLSLPDEEAVERVYGDWIEHHGDPCPVGPNTHGEVKLNDGSTLKAERIDALFGWEWQHNFTGFPGDIIAYRRSISIPSTKRQKTSVYAPPAANQAPPSSTAPGAMRLGPAFPIMRIG